MSSRCGCSSVAEHQLPKLTVRVRFPSPALSETLLAQIERPSREGAILSVSAFQTLAIPQRRERAPSRNSPRSLMESPSAAATSQMRARLAER